MSQSIELQVSLGLQQAESQASKLRELLKSSVKIDTSAFKSLNNALTGAEKQIAQLKSQMNSAFQTAGGSKKFLHDYDKLFESLSAIGSRFDFLKEADIIFSPESSAELKNMRSELEQLDGKIKQIKAGKIGNLFDDSSVDSIKEVQEVAESMKVTLSKTTFSEFGQKLAGKMAETKTQIEDLRKQAELLDQAVNNTSLSKNSIFSQMSMEKLMGNTSEVIDKDSARTLREKISSLYEQYGLTDVELGKTIKAGSNIDQIFIAEEERVRQSSDKYVKVLEEQKQKIQDELNKFDEGLKQSGGDGKRANWETKLAYIDEIKQKFSGLLTFSEVPASVRKDGTGITKYVEQFKQELAEGIKNLNVSDITKELQEKVRDIINGASTKSVITDASTFKTQVETILKDSFGGLDLKGVTDEIKNGMNIEDAIDRILVNVKNKIQSNGGAKALNDEADKLQAAYDKMARAGSTVKGVEANENVALKENEAAFASLTQKVLDYVAAKLGLTSSQVAQILNDESGAINKGRTALEQYIESLNKLEGKQKTLSSVQSAVTRWMGFYQVLNLTKKAINDMKQHIQELDTVMTQIAVVTNMSQEQLWGQIGKYSQIARQYGVAIKGVYEVSQIYYQQGLESNDVMTLTTETLKMARIAGLDYATAADYMTTAIRGFKLEMTDAAHVTDVFSALAASTASSTEELAVAISKTAASAANVGSSFEATSAMMATMIATTRESATNIGTALKSIISRYGEMTSKPEATTDSEGEEMSLNRVDKALQTIGITLHTTTGEFRNFDEVIMELAEKWDTLDSVSQRYIATIMAGNRQQSRFLALVSNVDEYKRALEVAQESEGSGELQMLKTLDSVDAKLEKMRVTIQEFYTSSGLETLYKNVIDIITNVISAANNLPKAFGKIPVQALAVGGAIVSAIKSILQLIISEISAGLEQMKGKADSTFDGLIIQAAAKGQEIGTAVKDGIEKGVNGAGASIGKQISGIILSNLGGIANLIGSGLTISGFSQYGASTTENADRTAGLYTLGGGILGVAGGALSGAATGAMLGAKAGPYGMAIGAVLGGIKGLITNFATLKSGADMLNVSLSRQIELSKKRLEEAKTEEAKAKGEQKELENAYEKLNTLAEHQHDSVEAMQDYQDYLNQLGDTYPKYVDAIKATGDITIDTTALERDLAQARQEAAAATLSATQAEKDTIEQQQASYKKLKARAEHPLFYDYDVQSVLNQQFRVDDSGYDIGGEAGWFAGMLLDQYSHLLSDNQWNKIFDTGIWNWDDLLSEVGDAAESALLEVVYPNAENNASMKNVLYRILDDAINENKDNEDFNLSFLTDNKINKLQDVFDLEEEDIVAVLNSIRVHAAAYIKNTEETLEKVDEAIERTEIRKSIQDDLNNMSLSDDNKQKKNAEMLQDYISFMTFLLDEAPVPGEENYEVLKNIILSDLEAADKLIHLDYSQFASIEDIDLDEYQGYKEKFEKEFTKERDTAINGLKDQLNSFDNLQLDYNTIVEGTEDIHPLINSAINNLRNNLTTYNSLISKELFALAENYRLNIEQFYTNLGNLTSAQQAKIVSIIPDIDFSDADSLRTAGETLQAMGGDYKQISDTLINAANRFVGNAQLILAQIAENVSETAKAIETAFDNQGKIFKRSEALKNAQELLSSYTGIDKENLDWSDLYEYSETAGGYIETQKAFEIRLANATSEATKNIQKAERAIGFEEITSKKLTPTVLNTLQRDRNKARADGKTYKDIYGSTVGFQDENLDAAWVQFETISKAWEDLNDTTRASYADFAAYYQERLEKDQEELEKVRKEIADMPKEMAQQYLKSDIDYKAIAGGTASKNVESILKTVLETTGATEGWDLEFEDYYAELLKGNFEKWNEYLHKFGLDNANISTTTGGEMLQSELQQYTTALDEIIAKKPYNALSQTTQQLVGTQTDYDGANVVSAAYSYVARIQELFNQGQASIEEVNAAIVKAMNFEDAENGIGKQKKALDAAKDGFTNEELVDLKLVEEIKNEAGEIIGYGLKADAKAYLEKDVLNGGWKAKGSQSMKDVVLALNEAFGLEIDTTSKEWQDFIKSDLQQQISDLDAADTAKQRTTAYASLAGAKVGDRLDVSALSSSVQDTLRNAGLDITEAGLLTVTSEEALNSGILALKEKLTKGHWAERHSLEASQIDSMVRDLEGRMNQLSGLSGIIGESVSHSAAQSFALAFEGTTEKASEIMDRMGAVWDELSQTWIIDEDDLGEIESYIQDLEAADTTGANATAIASMRAQLENLRDSFERRPVQALNDVLTNYTSVSNDIIATFDQYWLDKVDISEYIVSIDEVTGNKKIDIVGLKQALIEAGEDVEELFNEVIAQVTDELLGQLSTGVNFQISGTNNFTEMQSFVDNINEKLESDFTIDDLFSYNSVLNSFTLNTTAFNNYKKALEKELQDLHWSQDLIDEYIKDQTDVVIQQNIELDSFLNAQTSKERNDEANQLITQIRSLSNYKNLFDPTLLISKGIIHTVGDHLEVISEQYDLLILETLESGGQAAVDLLKQIKPDASQEEFEAAFSSQINKLNDVMSQVGDLVAGQFVGTEGKLYEILNYAGAVNDDGVVRAGFDMADVYTRIYAEMSNTEGHTTQGLNQVYAKLLTARAQSNLNLKDALSNAGGMSPDAFANLMNSYELNMEEVLHDNITNIIVDWFGNILIKDFQAFSNYMNEKTDANWNPNDPALKEIYSSYVDAKASLINQTINDTATATEQLSSVLEAKAGQAVNVSYLGLNDLFDNNEKVLNEYLAKFGAAYEDGILKIGSETAIPSLVHDIGQKLVQAGKIKPEQLAELEDSVAVMLDNIISLLSNGINGSLNNKDLITTMNWYTSLASRFPDLAKSLDVTNTAEGLQFTESSLANIYALLKRIDAQKADGFLDEIIDSKESFQTLTGALREFNDAMRLDGASEGTNKLKGFNGALSNTAKMMQDVVQKAMTNPDSMNFMSNKLPDDMQTAVNAWENASKAIKTITTAEKSGYMGVQDFYNIVNTASSLMEAAGKNFEVAGMNAATLLQKGAENVKVVDGKLTVDISSAGLNIVGSADQLKQNMATGINELADAEIAIIDAEIKVLEILAAMETLGDIDVDTNQNGINFEVSDIFDFDAATGDLKGYTSAMEIYLDQLQDAIKANDTAYKAAQEFKINGTSLWDLITGTADQWIKTFGSAENASKFWQNFSAGIEGWDLEGNLQEQVLNFFKGLDSELNVDLGENGLFHIGVNGSIYSVDFNNEQLMSDAAKVAKELSIDTKNNLPEKIKDIFNSNPQDITVEENLLLKVASGVVTVEYDKKGNIAGYKVNGKTYKDADMAAAVGDLIQAGVKKDLPKEDITLKSVGGQIHGTLTVGSTEIEVISDGHGAQYNKEGVTGGPFNDIDALYDAWFQQTEGDPNKEVDRSSIEYKTWKVKQGINIQTIFEVNKREGDINKNIELRNAVNDYLSGQNAESIEIDDKTTTVTLKNGIKAIIPNGELEFEIDEQGNKTVVQDSLIAYFRELTGQDLGLKETIISAITEAFTSLSSLLTTLDSSKVTELGSAFSTVYTNVQAVATGVQQLAENLAKLTGIDIKIEFNLPDLPIGDDGENGETTSQEVTVEYTTSPESDGALEAAITEEVSNAAEKAKTEAKNVPTGIAEGMKDTTAVKTAAGDQGTAVIEGFDEVLGIESPSTVMIEQAKFVGEGIVEGLNESKRDVATAAEELGNVIVTKIEETVTKVTAAVNKIVEAFDKIKETKIDIDNTKVLKSIEEIQTALEKLSETKPKIEVDTATAEGQLEALKNKLKQIDTQQIIHPEGQIEDIDDFDTTQTINTSGGVYDIPDFVTIQRIKTVGGGGGGCFIAGTKIYMADGTIKNIEDIYLDDVVIAYNPMTNEFVPRKVIDGYTHHNTERVVAVEFSDSTILKMTPSHPILTTKGWKSLEPITSLDEHGILPNWLEIGDIIIGYNGEVTVTDIKELSVPQNYDTYDFEVEDCHTFLAEGIPVHNAMITGPARAASVPVMDTGGGSGKAKGNATWLNPMGQTFAKGNVSGQALAGGRQRTLMGELGPELYVSGGRYFVAGQNGAEFVNLPDDAIVFNHMQTKSLMMKGQTGHGTPVTTEKNAISWAKGNVEGPAQASASAALATLKQLRAMWESLRKAKVSDLAGAGGGGGGGGGGKDDSPQIVDPRTWIATVERWYNLTQEIAKLEKEITYQHQIREKIQSDWQKDGKAYYASQKKSLSALEDQIDAQEQLNVSRQEYYNKRIAALKEDKFGQIYTFDEEGQLKFNKNANLTLGDKTYTNAMEWYTDLIGFDNDKGANYTNKEKYEMLVANGFESYMKYDENGQEIKMDSDNDGEITDEERESYYENATKAFKDKLDSYAEATQSLWDEIQEGNETLEELETERNNLLKEMRDNQIDLENKVLDAIVEARQREIDELQDTRDALEESVGKYIDGLTNALNKEQSMYETQENQDDLNRKKRQLAILQRSGGSASEIASLQDEINSSERDLYFDLQQKQIDTIQEASDLEIERLDHQIEIMSQTLEYQKEFGLLWGQVYEVMSGSAAEISSFIKNNSSEVWEKSPLQQDSWWNETLFSADEWEAYRDDVTVMADETRAQQLARDYAIFDQAMKAEYGDDYDSTGKWKEKFKEVYEDAAQGGRSETQTRKILQGDIAEEAYVRSKQKLAEEHGVSYIGTGEWSYKSINDKEHYAYHYEKKNGQWTYVNRSKENHEWSGQACSKCGHVKPAPANSGGGGGGGGGSSSNSGICEQCQSTCFHTCAKNCQQNNENNGGNCNGNCIGDCQGHCGGNCKGVCRDACKGQGEKKGLSKVNGKASGGFVSHGLYELGERGTETVLTAQQTQILRNNILSNRPNSLISLLKTYNDGFSRMSTPLTGEVSNDNSTNIDNVSINMNVQQISNDYDARRAGEQAMNEIMRIARKTSAANSVRR